MKFSRFVSLNEEMKKDWKPGKGNPWQWYKKPKNRKEAQSNLNAIHYEGMVSDKEIEAMGHLPVHYKTYIKTMRRDAQRVLDTFKEEVELEEEMTEAQKKKREEIVLSMKKNKDELQKKYGDDWENVMYATATKQAMSEAMSADGKTWTTKSGKKIERYPTHHTSYSGAVQAAIAYAKKQGYEISDEDWDNKVATGPRKPSSGKTNSFSIELDADKSKKPVGKKMLHLQVYNADNKYYELNTYVS